MLLIGQEFHFSNLIVRNDQVKNLTLTNYANDYHTPAVSIQKKFIHQLTAIGKVKLQNEQFAVSELVKATRIRSKTIITAIDNLLFSRQETVKHS